MSAQRQRAYVSRPESARQSNERIAEQAERLHFVSRVPMVCECDDGDCRQILLLDLDEYRKVRREAEFLTAPGHAIADAGRSNGSGSTGCRRADRPTVTSRWRSP
jgi:hypothetical protein